jgi:hypothetical protein
MTTQTWLAELESRLSTVGRALEAVAALPPMPAPETAADAATDEIMQRYGQVLPVGYRDQSPPWIRGPNR